MAVYRQVSLAFTLGKYRHEILYDVVPMEATHILLGLRQVVKEFGSDIHAKEDFGSYNQRSSMSPKDAFALVPRNHMCCANSMLPKPLESKPLVVCPKQDVQILLGRPKSNLQPLDEHQKKLPCCASKKSSFATLLNTYSPPKKLLNHKGERSKLTNMHPEATKLLCSSTTLKKLYNMTEARKEALCYSMTYQCVQRRYTSPSSLLLWTTLLHVSTSANYGHALFFEKCIANDQLAKKSSQSAKTSPRQSKTCERRLAKMTPKKSKTHGRRSSKTIFREIQDLREVVDQKDPQAIKNL
ncbi:hypothetical protein CR513_50123, partial [Mucuna pruriens]